MANVFDRAGGQIVDHQNVVAPLQVCVSEMRTDKTSTACDKYAQIKLLYTNIVGRIQLRDLAS